MLLLLAHGRLQLAPCSGVGGSPLLPLLLSLPPLLLLLLSVCDEQHIRKEQLSNLVG
jgi:hypothetical protein